MMARLHGANDVVLHEVVVLKFAFQITDAREQFAPTDRFEGYHNQRYLLAAQIENCSHLVRVYLIKILRRSAVFSWSRTEV
jgi:hypothetical protein